MNKAVCLWFTGITDSGKTTIANMVASILRQQGIHGEIIDGGMLRANAPNIGFDRDGREYIAYCAIYEAYRVMQDGGIAICTLISPDFMMRQIARYVLSQYGEFIEIHVATPVEVCERRDTKGLYRKYRKGEIRNMAGKDVEYEVPISPEIIVGLDGEDAEIAAWRVVEYLREHVLK